MSVSPPQHAGHAIITNDTVTMVDLRWFFFFSNRTFIDCFIKLKTFYWKKHSFYFQDGTEQEATPATSLAFIWISIVPKGNNIVKLFFFRSLWKMPHIIALSKQTTTTRLMDWQCPDSSTPLFLSVYAPAPYCSTFLPLIKKCMFVSDW